MNKYIGWEGTACEKCMHCIFPVYKSTEGEWYCPHTHMRFTIWNVPIICEECTSNETKEPRDTERPRGCARIDWYA